MEQKINKTTYNNINRKDALCPSSIVLCSIGINTFSQYTISTS